MCSMYSVHSQGEVVVQHARHQHSGRSAGRRRLSISGRSVPTSVSRFVSARGFSRPPSTLPSHTHDHLRRRRRPRQRLQPPARRSSGCDNCTLWFPASLAMIILDEDEEQFPKIASPPSAHPVARRPGTPTPSLPDYETSQEHEQQKASFKLMPRSRRWRWIIYGLVAYFVVTVAIGVPLIVVVCFFLVPSLSLCP